MNKKKLHLVCNAHIDPVWLWDWEEGAAETLSTFEVAAELCEKYDTFVFNHNEAILYQWVEDYAPGLFERIKVLVKQGRWHVMGGWYLQPDCNMLNGESVVRQILTGRCYFAEKFGVRPTTAMNVDAFGHSQGMVQILVKSGFDHYLFGRPLPKDLELPAEDFVWRGLDGSEVRVTRFQDWYNTLPGRAAGKLEDRLRKKEAPGVDILLWGVGNHGGGPSRKDLKAIQEIISTVADVEIMHSTPEKYCRDKISENEEWPVFSGSLRPWGVGTYTSMHSIKQRHRTLENRLYMVEKMVTAAHFQGLMEYPSTLIKEATKDLLKVQFHDVITGTCIPAAEESSLRIMDHGLEILARLRQKVFFLYAQFQKRAPEGQYVILVHNPHPYKLRQIVEVEFILPEVVQDGSFFDAQVFSGKKAMLTQVEKETSNKAGEWHKKIAFMADLEPGQMNRFVARTKCLDSFPVIDQPGGQSALTFDNGDMIIKISRRTGLLDSYCVNGREYLRGKGAELQVMKDGQNSWGMFDSRYDEVMDRFRLARQEEASRVAGLPVGRLPAVRLIEDGPVRRVVEAIFVCGDSTAIVRYFIPCEGVAVEVAIDMVWNEKNRMLKLSFPLTFGSESKLLGETAFGHEELASDGSEQVAQQWAVIHDGTAAFSCINDSTYGLDYSGHGGLRLSLVRGVAYGSCQRVPADRYTPRVDIGRNCFRFRIAAGELESRLSQITREAQIFHQTPFVLSLTPVGNPEGPAPECFIRLSGEGIVLSALKRAEDGRGLIVRLAETTGKKSKTVLTIVGLGVAERLSFSPFEVKTLRVAQGRFEFCSMVEV